MAWYVVKHRDKFTSTFTLSRNITRLTDIVTGEIYLDAVHPLDKISIRLFGDWLYPDCR